MKNQIHNIFIAVAAALISFANPTSAKTVYTSNVATGNWSAPGTWTSSGSGSPVVYKITAGNTITLDINIANVDTLWVNGTFYFNSNKNITINAGGAVILDWAGNITGGSNNSEFIFTGTSIHVAGAFTGVKNITNGPRWANSGTVIAANGDPQGSFVSLPTLLPVVLKSIQVNKSADIATLVWTAIGQSNQYSFVVEVSDNGRDFTTAAIVNGSNELTEGNYSHNLGLANRDFYVRLSEVANGVKTILSVQFVKNENNSTAFKLFPNLLNAAVSQNIQLVIPAAGNYNISVLALNMTQVATAIATSNVENELVHLNQNWNLNAGQYIVILTGDNGQVYKSRILVK